MKLDHIYRIRNNISLMTNLKATNTLDGAYRSIFKGKSLNFEELREYNIGDNIKDIDWHASARSMNVLVRQHIAEKKHNVLFILDSKYDMNANANPKDLKRDLCINACGTLAYFAYKNGDYVGAIFMHNGKHKFFPLRQDLFSIENFLTYYEEDLKNQNIKSKIKNSINDSIRYVNSYMKKKAIVFIISDMEGFDEIDEDLLKLLSYRNDIMAIQINDVGVYETKSYDIDNRKYFSSMFLKNKKLKRAEEEIKNEIYISNTNKLKKYNIALVQLDSMEELGTKILELIDIHNDIIN